MGFFAIVIDPSLSLCKSVGTFVYKIPSSECKLQSQHASCPASDIVTYSASVEDRAFDICFFELQVIQLLKKLSQCFAILERVAWNKSNKLSNIVKVMYVILHHLGFRKYYRSCDLDQN